VISSLQAVFGRQMTVNVNMKSAVLTTTAIALVVLWSRPVPAEDLRSQIVGIWKVRSVECVDLDGKDCSTPLDKLPRYYVFTRGGTYIKGSSSGAYTIEGGKVTITYDEQTNFPPTILAHEISVSGNLMTLKSMPVVSKMARSMVVFTIVAEKID
jgi:hypothetical protein